MDIRWDTCCSINIIPMAEYKTAVTRVWYGLVLQQFFTKPSIYSLVKSYRCNLENPIATLCHTLRDVIIWTYPKLQIDANFSIYFLFLFNGNFILFFSKFYFSNRPVSQIPHVLTECPTMHNFVTITKWCIVGYWIGALWDLCNKPIAIELKTVGPNTANHSRQILCWSLVVRNK